MKKILTVVGARPQFVKCAAVSSVLRKQYKEVLIHTGQHYDYAMSDVFFEELSIPKPEYHLGVGSASHGVQTSEMLAKIEEIILQEKPNAVMVYGDTNSTLAAALAASKVYVPLIHVEAGLRSFNRRMPEEINRVLTDHTSSLLLCPTETAMENLEREGFLRANVHATCSPEHPVILNVGDVMYDMVRITIRQIEKKGNTKEVLKQFGVVAKQYCLATIHRAENTNDVSALREILSAMAHIASKIPVVLPLHPRTKAIIERENIALPSGVSIIAPLGYADMILLQKNASVVCTDSGGMQKEAFLLQTPCITMREQTEWIETLHDGWNVLTGASASAIIAAYNNAQILEPDTQKQPFGDGFAGEKITQAIGTFIA